MVILPEAATLFTKFKTNAAVTSVKVVPSVLANTLKEPVRPPAPLKITDQSKLMVPASTPVKSIKKSMAAEEVLSVVPVDTSTIELVCIV